MKNIGRLLVITLGFYIPTGTKAQEAGARAKIPTAPVIALVECEVEMSWNYSNSRMKKVFRGVKDNNDQRPVINETFNLDGLPDPDVRLYVSYLPASTANWPYHQLAISLSFGDDYPAFSSTSNVIAHHRKEALVLYRPSFLNSKIKGIVVSCEIKPLNK